MEEWVSLENVKRVFRHCFYDAFKTELIGGAEEPFYKAPTESQDGQLCFRFDYLRSALHESAHWCLAGAARLKLDDWGYWYHPDGRDFGQQLKFFEAEVKPQAIEKAFCEALGVEFAVSVDNLAGPSGPALEFAEAVERQFAIYLRSGFPKRAEFFRSQLLLSKKKSGDACS